MNILNELLDRLCLEKDIIEQILVIDNEINNSNISFEYLKEILCNVLLLQEIKLEKDALFITEGDPNITLLILKSILSNPNNEYVLFINQGFYGINEWLIKRFKQLTNNKYKIELDDSINYNKYINNKKYKVLPLGETALINQVLEDFN